MEMEKRMQKAHISKHEIPLLGLDVGGVTCKVTFFEVTYNSVSAADLEASYENPVNVNVAGEKIQNREVLKRFMEEYAIGVSISHTVREFEIKGVEGMLHCYLFRRERLNDFMNMLNSLELKRPFFVLTGTALVNYITKLEDQFHARIIIIPSEDESLVRGIEVMHYQPQCALFYEHDYRTGSMRPITTVKTDHFYPCLLVSIGTSTTYLLLNSQTEYTRLNASAISGQTFLGIANAGHRLAHSERYKKDDVQSFDQCLKMATNGHTSVYDITVKQMCGNNDKKVEQFLFLHSFGRQNEEDYIQEFGELPVTVFGEVDPRAKEERIKDKGALFLAAAQRSTQGNQAEINDFSAATLNMICYTIAETMYMYAKLLRLNLILCSGSFLSNNQLAKNLIAKHLTLLAHNQTVLESKRKNLYFLDNEAFLAAIGCIGIDTRNIDALNLND